MRIAGQDGVVADITPFTTVLNTIDNREITVTNDKAWGDVIVNSSARSLRRIDQLFSISYDDDIDQAIGIIRSRTGATADEAFARLREISQGENVKLSLVAERMVEEAVRRAQARHANS